MLTTFIYVMNAPPPHSLSLLSEILIEPAVSESSRLEILNHGRE